MLPRLRITLPVAFLSGPAAANPAWKQVPGGKGEDQGGFSLNVDTSFMEWPWVQTGMQFLADYYGYLGVVFVILVLFLFSRTSGDGAAAEETVDPDEEDFFDAADAERFRDTR